MEILFFMILSGFIMRYLFMWWHEKHPTSYQRFIRFEAALIYKVMKFIKELF